MGDDNRVSPKGQMIAMIDVKAELKARIADGAKYEKNVVLRITNVGDFNDKGIATITCRVLQLQKDGSYLPYYVDRMKCVDANMVAIAQARVTKAENTLEDLKKVKDADTTDAEKAVEDAKAYLGRMVIDTFIPVKDNQIFLSSVDFLVPLANNPATANVAKYIREDKDLIKAICSFCTTNLLVEKVGKNQIYNSIYSEKVSVCPNESYYWTPIGQTLCEEGVQWVEDIKAKLKEEKINALLKRDVGKKAVSQQRDDNDD